VDYTQDYRYKTESNTLRRVQEQNLKGDNYAVSLWNKKEKKEKEER
tara:strand:- start:4074 stop:4211 length:138 start_codon:yes stop_codon:yes gene_type:complete